MATLKLIEQIVNQQNIAIAGVSISKKKTRSSVYNELKKKGYNVFAINSKMDTFDGDKCYKSVKELPDEVNVVFISTKPHNGINIIKEAVEKGIEYIWIQQGAESDEIVDFCKSKNLNFVHKHCMLMFAKPDSIHKVHGWLKKVFGTYPK